MEIPSASDIRELVGSLAFRTEGTGLGFSYGDVMGMTLGEALAWNRYQARRYQEINDAHNKAGRS